VNTTSLKTGINIVGREFFQVFLVTYLLLTLAETFREGFVSNFFNMNWLLLVVLVSGIMMVLTEPADAAARFRKRAARAVVVLTARQERREYIQRRKAALAAKQHQLVKQRITDLRLVDGKSLKTTGCLNYCLR
jgi:hypothetical protein